MRRIDARRGTQNFKALFPTEFELLTKNHQGALWPPPPPPSGRGLIGDTITDVRPVGVQARLELAQRGGKDDVGGEGVPVVYYSHAETLSSSP